MSEPILCYVKGPWAYFTTQPLDKQWGDDWNDAPYEHNAGEPYEYGQHNLERGDPPWEITKVAWDGPFNTPDDGCANSRWSVEQINAGAIAWLTDARWNANPLVMIHAGTTLKLFRELVKQAGGKVYEEAQ